MKCPACWAEKAYRRTEEGQGLWAKVLWALGFVPMRCRHCYHKFWTHRLLVLGQVLDAPAKQKSAPAPEKSSVAAEFVSQQSSARRQDAAPPRRRAA